MEDAEEAIEHWKIEVFEYNVKSKLKVTSLLFVKARFYTHLLDPSKKTFAWEDRYIIHCSGASAILDNQCRVLGFQLRISRLKVCPSSTIYPHPRYTSHHNVPLPFPKGCGPFHLMLEEYAQEGKRGTRVTHELGGPGSAFFSSLFPYPH